MSCHKSWLYQMLLPVVLLGNKGRGRLPTAVKTLITWLPTIRGVILGSCLKKRQVRKSQKEWRKVAENWSNWSYSSCRYMKNFSLPRPCQWKSHLQVRISFLSVRKRTEISVVFLSHVPNSSPKLEGVFRIAKSRNQEVFEIFIFRKFIDFRESFYFRSRSDSTEFHTALIYETHWTIC